MMQKICLMLVGYTDIISDLVSQYPKFFIINFEQIYY